MNGKNMENKIDPYEDWFWVGSGYEQDFHFTPTKAQKERAAQVFIDAAKRVAKEPKIIFKRNTNS